MKPVPFDHLDPGDMIIYHEDVANGPPKIFSVWLLSDRAEFEWTHLHKQQTLGRGVLVGKSSNFVRATRFRHYLDGTISVATDPDSTGYMVYIWADCVILHEGKSICIIDEYALR